MNTDMEHWKKMLPFITAFANGETVAFDGDSDDAEAFCFNKDPSRYSIIKPKERVPLEAEDWIKDGPWWVRRIGDPSKVFQISRIGNIGPVLGGDLSGQENPPTFMADRFERRNATSEWMPCWKEKE